MNLGDFPLYLNVKGKAEGEFGKMDHPMDLKYSEEHVWVRIEGKRARLGLTDFYQDELGSIVYADLPRPGDELVAGDPFGSVESIKTVTELTSPLSGKVLESNRALSDMPGKINLDPYNSWLFVMEWNDETEVDRLWSVERYVASIPQKPENEE